MVTLAYGKIRKEILSLSWHSKGYVKEFHSQDLKSRFDLLYEREREEKLVNLFFFFSIYYSYTNQYTNGLEATDWRSRGTNMNKTKDINNN